MMEARMQQNIIVNHSIDSNLPVASSGDTTFTGSALTETRSLSPHQPPKDFNKEISTVPHKPHGVAAAH